MLISQKTKICLQQCTMRLLTVSLWLKTCSLSAVFFKDFITQGDCIFYSGVEILQIKTTTVAIRCIIAMMIVPFKNKTNF